MNSTRKAYYQGVRDRILDNHVKQNNGNAAFVEGLKACKEGISSDDNPYVGGVDVEKEVSWSAGWNVCGFILGKVIESFKVSDG